ncbi:hypothetical protein AMJ57_03590 [Parcubacteria bacterium SG8_24]|nr:MAG: hypothetical protein AMJ57_03590 [Parcubacteria bacterium SG8_24]
MNKRHQADRGVGRKGQLAVALGLLALTAAVHLMVTRFPAGDTDTETLAPDRPPVIEFFSDSPAPRPLRVTRGRVRLEDDRGLDFSTYRMTAVELGRTIRLPIEGMLATEYEQDISLALLLTEPGAGRLEYITLEFFVADDSGQGTILSERVELVPVE